MQSNEIFMCYLEILILYSPTSEIEQAYQLLVIYCNVALNVSHIAPMCNTYIILAFITYNFVLFIFPCVNVLKSFSLYSWGVSAEPSVRLSLSIDVPSARLF